MTNDALELLPAYWRGRAAMRLHFAEQAERIDDQTYHTRCAAEHEAKATELEKWT